MLKDPRNLEFARLLSISGWNQSEAARQLDLTPAAISRYLGGQTRPSTTVLQLFQLLLGDTKGVRKDLVQPEESGIEGGRRMTEEEATLLRELGALDNERRTAVLKALCDLIRALSPEKKGPKPGQRRKSNAKPKTSKR
jgi:predicted transcriptional regulator